MPERRRFLGGALGAGALACMRSGAAAGPGTVPGTDVSLTPAEEVVRSVAAARPSQGGAIPRDLPRRFGIAHVEPKYRFTAKPILIEGAEKILTTNARGAKFWLMNLAEVYALNSEWRDLPADAGFVQRVRHPSFEAALALPFETVALEVGTAPGTRAFAAGENYARDEEEMEALAAHLLAAYADRPLTFILQNWEGDWLIRGENKDWAKRQPPDAGARMDSMAAWWRARQRGVARARRGAPPGCRCSVLHAAEVNRVADAFRGIPVAATHALPQAAVDLVSWSCYDGIDDPVKAWHCLEVLAHFVRTEDGGPAPIMIGEIGRPETGRVQHDVVDWWDRALGVLLAWGVHSIFHWELFCNEPRDPALRHRDLGPVVKPDDMRGFWWFRPDGTTSWGGEYLDRVLARAGRRGLG